MSNKSHQRTRNLARARAQAIKDKAKPQLTEEQKQSQKNHQAVRNIIIATVIVAASYFYLEYKFPTPNTPSKTTPAWKTQDRAQRSIEAAEIQSAIK
jgi:hypothetical protein